MIPFVDLARGFRQTPDGQFTPISSDFVGAMEKIKTGAFITSKDGYRKSRQAEEVMGGQVRFDRKHQTLKPSTRNRWICCRSLGQAEEVVGGQVRFDQLSTAQNKTSRNPHGETHVHATCAGISVRTAPGRY